MRALAVVVLLTLPSVADPKGLLRKGRDLQAAKKSTGLDAATPSDLIGVHRIAFP